MAIRIEPEEDNELLTKVTKGLLVVADTSPVSGSFAGSQLREAEDYEDGTARLDVEWPGL